MDQHPKIQTAPDGTLLLNFGQYGRAVDVGAISGDGQRVLTVREIGVAEIWDAVSGRRVAEIQPDSPLQGTMNTTDWELGRRRRAFGNDRPHDRAQIRSHGLDTRVRNWVRTQLVGFG